MGAANADAGEKATSRDNLSLYNADPAEFICRYVTMDETLAHHFDPETKQQSKLRLRNDLYCVEWGVKLYSLTY